MEDETLEGQDFVGPGFLPAPPIGLGGPPPPQRRIMSVKLPVFPGKGRSSEDAVEIQVTVGNREGDVTIEAEVKGVVACEEEYHAVMSFFQGLV